MVPYCIIFRKGGTANFSWHRTMPMPREECQIKLAEMRTAGHTCHMERSALSVAIGLPETYNVAAIGTLGGRV